jgi:ferredoxin
MLMHILQQTLHLLLGLYCLRRWALAENTAFASAEHFVKKKFCSHAHLQCIGCGKCVRQCPSTFEIEASKYGRARVVSQVAEPPEDIQIAMEVCPVSCIYWVRCDCCGVLVVA